MVVELVKKYKKAVTLAIGDGANDVSMIKSKLNVTHCDASSWPFNTSTLELSYEVTLLKGVG